MIDDGLSENTSENCDYLIRFCVVAGDTNVCVMDFFGMTCCTTGKYRTKALRAN